MSRKRSILIGFLFLYMVFLINGCASTKGSYNSVMTPTEEELLAKYCNIDLSVECQNDVSLSLPVKERILKLIAKNLSTECPGCFKSINPRETLPDTMHVSVMIRRYDEGNAFARAMLAGLGQMHIDADVVLTDLATKEPLAKYDVTKSFAWGGIYGASTGIKDIEDGFAMAVAAAIAGNPIDRPNQKTANVNCKAPDGRSVAAYQPTLQTPQKNTAPTDAPVILDTNLPLDKSDRRMTDPKNITVKYDTIKIFDMPGKSNIIATRTKGDVLTAIGENDNWFLVEFAPRKTGWVAKEWVLTE